MSNNRRGKPTIVFLVTCVLVALGGCGGGKDAGASLAEGAPQGILVVVLGGAPADGTAGEALRSWADGRRDSVRFDRHYANGVSTETSLRALLTGFPFESTGDTAARPTLAELSSRLGYGTFALATGGARELTGTAGFELVENELDPADPIPAIAKRIEATGGPFLGFVYVPDDGAAADWLVELSGLPRFAETLVAVTSDLGTAPDDADVESQFRESVIHVPLVVKFPAGEKPETLPARTSSITSGIDLLPSLLAWMGRDISGALPGSNILDGYFTGAAFVAGDEAWAFLQDNHKVIVSGEKAWVFDLAAEGGETTDLTTTEPDLAEGLLRLAVQTREMMSRDAVTEADEDMDEETLEHLRSLGYIQ